MANTSSALALILLLLVVVNMLGNLVVDGGVYVMTNLAAAVAAVATARAGGTSWAQLGLARQDLSRGIVMGLLAAAAIALAVIALVVSPARSAFVESGEAVQPGMLVWELLVRIPLGTALPEEVLFRSALLGVLLQTVTATRAVLWSSLVFGLWHVLPTLGTGPVSGGAATAVGTVVATAIAGVVLAWLRLRSGSVAAPVLAHVAINGVGLLAAANVAGPR